jgi:signal transduction histidine kinase
MVRSEGYALFARPLDDRRLVAADVGVAVAYVGLSAVLWHASPALPGVPGSDLAGPVADLLIVTTGLPLAVRRLWPVPVLLVVLVASAAAVGLGAVRDPFVAAAFAVYPVALARPWRAAQAVVAVAVVGVAAAVGGAPVGPSPYWWWSGPGLLLVGAVLVVGAWMLGTAVRERRAFAARAADELAERAVTRERLRIARELHDVVTHGIGLIAVQAAVANHVVASRPEEAGAALRVIETASRGALAEMRQMLGVLRAGSGAGGVLTPVSDPPDSPTPADLAPTPGVADLDRLAARAAQAGLRVTTRLDGVGDLPESVGLTVYRIVQEALTNATRHAAPAACRVTVASVGGVVTVEVVDDGRAGSATGGPEGYGLIGMRERVAMYGGTLTVGPLPGGGFRVAARLPYGGES